MKKLAVSRNLIKMRFINGLLKGMNLNALHKCIECDRKDCKGRNGVPIFKCPLD